MGSRHISQMGLGPLLGCRTCVAKPGKAEHGKNLDSAGSQLDAHRPTPRIYDVHMQKSYGVIQFDWLIQCIIQQCRTEVDSKKKEKTPFQLPPCPQNTFHQVKTPQTPFATAPMPQKHISPSANTSKPLCNCPHALKKHFTSTQIPVAFFPSIVTAGTAAARKPGAAPWW